MNSVHWPLMGGLLHLVQRGGDWAGLQTAHARWRCTHQQPAVLMCPCTPDGGITTGCASRYNAATCYAIGRASKMHGVYKKAVLPFSPREGFERGSARPQNTFEF